MILHDSAYRQVVLGCWLDGWLDYACVCIKQLHSFCMILHTGRLCWDDGWMDVFGLCMCLHKTIAFLLVFFFSCCVFAVFVVLFLCFKSQNLLLELIGCLLFLSAC
jgi:hypothetical protein